MRARQAVALRRRQVCPPSPFLPSLHVAATSLRSAKTWTVAHPVLSSQRSRCDPSVPQGVVLASNPQRQWLNVSVGEGVDVEPVDLGGRGAWLGEVDLEVGFAARSTEDPETFSADEIAKHLISVRAVLQQLESSCLGSRCCAAQGREADAPPPPHGLPSHQRYSGLPLSLSQPLVFDFRGRSLKALVRTLAVLDLSLSSEQEATKNVSVGILTETTDITVRKDEGSRIKIKASGKKCVPPLSPLSAVCAGESSS